VSGFLVGVRDPRSPAAEAFRTLRTSLAFATPQPVKTLLVTSPGPSEGKTTVVANLAVALGQAGRRVVVVDADLRKPHQHEMFAVPNHRGLTNVLVGQAELGKVVVETSVPGVALLTSGPVPPNPAELLDTATARSVWDRLAKEYDLVLVDSPPAAVVTDAVIIASQVEAVLVVVKAGTTRNEALAECRERLQKAGARVLGAVLNEVRPGGGYYYYPYRYYYYGRDRARGETD
jgi:capsular exopolysaccharide synthesis family protein